MSAICDFCSRPDPEWFYSAATFDMPHIAWGSSGGWAACEECSDLIEAGDNVKVVRKRMMGTALENALAGVPGLRLTRSEKAEVEHQTWALFNKFLNSRRGARRAFG